MFSAEDPDPEPGVLDLVKSLNTISVPIAAASGIMDGHSVREVIAVGAASGMLGTAFLLSPEAGTSEPYRQAIRVAIRRPHRPPTVQTESEPSCSEVPG